MKKKLTLLLIALSITFTIIGGYAIMPVSAAMSNSIITIEENIEILDEDPLPPIAVESEPEPVISEAAAADTLPKVESKPQQTEIKDNTIIPTGDYPEAIYIWNRLKEEGYNDYICAGILGNLMAEVGGQTLDLSRWKQYSNPNKGYYGICQWSAGRKSNLLKNYGSSLEAQVDFLIAEMNGAYYNTLNNNGFFKATNEKTAALIFAKKYEICSSKYYNIRQKNATKALKYFTQ